jgi:hypothetical protein
MSKGKPLDRYDLRVRPEKENPNEIAWIIQAFIIFYTLLLTNPCIFTRYEIL